MKYPHLAGRKGYVCGFLLHFTVTETPSVVRSTTVVCTAKKAKKCCQLTMMQYLLISSNVYFRLTKRTYLVTWTDLSPREENIGEKKWLSYSQHVFRVQIFLVIYNSVLSMFIVFNTKLALHTINGVRRKNIFPGWDAHILKEGIRQWQPCHDLVSKTIRH